MRLLIYNPLVSDLDWVVGSFRTEEMCRELSKHGVEGVVASPRLSTCRNLPGSFVAQPLPKNPIQRLRDLMSKAAQGEFDIVQERPMPGDIASNGFGWIVSLRTGIPFVLELHNLGRRRRFLKNMHFLPLSYWRASAVLHYAALETIFPFSVSIGKAIPVPNGYSQSLVDEIRGFERTIFNLGNLTGDRTAFGYFGEISSDKGVDVLLRIAGILRKNPKVVFVFGGKGSMDEIVRRESLENPSNVIHLGLLTRRETLACMSQCQATIALHPPWQARIGNPVKVVESLALGIPAIISHDFVIPEVLRSLCATSDYNDVHATARIVTDMAGKKNPHLVSEDVLAFSTENIVENTLIPAYRRVVGE